MACEKRWRDPMAVAQPELGDATRIDSQGQDQAVFGGRDFVTEAHARSTDGAANLCDGYFDGRSVACPLHQSLFDARTEAVLAAPARLPLRMVECGVVDGALQVRM